MSEIILETSPDGFTFLTEEQALTASPFRGQLVDWVGRDGSIPVYEWTYPELGPGRIIERGNGMRHVILPIGGRNYLVTIAHRADDDGHPTGARINFLETKSELTPATLMPEGTNRTSHFFGQPRFVQGGRFPMFEGRPAYVLAVLETGWGDCGNEIIWIGLDDDNRPARALHQADCA